MQCAGPRAQKPADVAAGGTASYCGVSYIVKGESEAEEEDKVLLPVAGWQDATPSVPGRDAGTGQDVHVLSVLSLESVLGSEWSAERFAEVRGPAATSDLDVWLGPYLAPVSQSRAMFQCPPALKWATTTSL